MPHACRALLRRCPLAAVAVAFPAACRWGPDALSLAWPAALWLAPALLVLLVVSASSKRLPRAPVLLPAAALAAALAGSLHALQAEHHGGGELARWDSLGVLERLLERPVVVRGRVAGLVRRAGWDRAVVDVELESVGTGRLTLPVRARLALAGDAEWGESLDGAGRVEAWAVLRRPQQERNPGSPVRPRRDGPHLVGSITAGSLSHSGDASVRPLLLRLRCRIAGGLDAALARDARARGLARALVLGSTDRLDADLRDSLRASGAAHVLSVSGLHVALVVGALVRAAGALGVARRRAALAGLALAWAFAVVAGFGVPVVRAACLVSAFVVAEVLSRGLPSWNALAAAALASAAVHPLSALGPSYVLTFAATAALVGLAPVIRPLLPAGRRVLTRSAWDLLAASVAAWIALVPPSAVLFHQVNLLAPAWNLAAVPLAGLATVSSLATAAVSVASPSAAFLPARATSVLAELLDASQRWGEVGSLRTSVPSSVMVVVAAAALIGTCSALGPRSRAISALVAAASLVLILASRSPPLPASVVARVHVLDVGQGSAALVEIARTDGAPWRALVDAGGRPRSQRDVGERVVAPALAASGLTRLDAVVLTHGDFDHRGGAPAVIRWFRPERVIVPPVAAELRGVWADCEEAARDVGARWEVAAAGVVLVEAEATLVVAAPPRDPSRRRSLSENDAGLVLRLRGPRGDGWALMPADLERAGELGLCAADRALESALLLAGHHGSRTSTTPTLLDAVRPRAAVISAGRANPFGHPHPEVVARLEHEGLAPWLTARDGAIRVSFGRVMTIDAEATGRVEIRAVRGGAWRRVRSSSP